MVATIVDWYRSDANVAVFLPRLATYLSHLGPTKGNVVYSKRSDELEDSEALTTLKPNSTLKLLAGGPRPLSK